MTSVVSADRDRLRLLQSKKDECSAIARSRKRKIRELFAVATAVENLPNISLANPDAPPSNEAESRFLDGCDILQGRKLNELSVPARPKPRYDALRLSSLVGSQHATENAAATSSKSPVHHELKTVGQAAVATEVDSKGLLQQPKVDVISVPKTTEIQSGSAVVPANPKLDSNQIVQSVERTAKSPSSLQSQNPPAVQNEQLSNVCKSDAHGPAVVEISRPPREDTRRAIPSVSANTNQKQPTTGPNDLPTQQAVRRPEVMESDPMDIDDPATDQEPKSNAPLSLNIAQVDVSRHIDALSSPGSTAQTATTPAVQDVSANTSPDHDGAQYMDKAEDMSIDKSTENETPVPKVQDPVEQDTSAAGTSNEIEAQLLRDSADAANAKATMALDATSTLNTATSPVKTPLEQSPGKPAGNVPDTRHVTHPSTSSQNLLAPVGVSSVSEASSKPSVEESPAQSEGINGRKDAQAAVNDEESQEDTTQLPPLPSTLPQQSDRAVTRVSTGAIRQKSVSEILSGSNPKAASEIPPLAPITPISQSPRPRARSLIEKAKSKEKSKLSTVVFGKQPQRSSDASKSGAQSRAKTPGQIPSDDYFTPLFVQGFSNGGKWMKPMDQILHHAHKTVSTTDAYKPITDNQACRVLRRVYALQQQDKWSLRQLKRCPEPTRPPSHWDVVLQEMKWMRTDFREERKFKSTLARNIALACADWVSLKDFPEEQKALQVNAVTPQNPPKPQWVDGDLRWSREDVAMSDVMDGNDAENHPTPDLIPSADTNSPPDHDDDPVDNPIDTIPPSAIFALQDDDVLFELHPSPNTDRLLQELPMYGSPLKVPDSSLTAPKWDPDARWRREALPLSKYVEGRMELVSSEPPRKRSRYQYAQEDDDEDEALFNYQPSPQTKLEPANPDVALFRTENKTIRDRLHAGHQFRPPHEHSMPAQSFYDSRSCSQWTMSEDDELKTLVREYSYNWSLISGMLSTKSEFTSCAERRTPWECFERWVMLEGLPHDMQKTQYFKLWQNRIDTAVRQHNQMAMTAQAQHSQNGAAGPATPAPKRRVSTPQKVLSRRGQKHLTMIDSMRKLAKKRETALQKQQHAASLAAMRKAQEQPPPRSGPTKTPREYSIMRWERDQAIAERLAERLQQQQQRMEAQRRAAAMQARAQQQGQAAQISAQNANAQMQPNAAHPNASAMAVAAAARTNGLNQMAINGQARPRMPMPPTSNGNGSQGPIAGALVPPMQMNGNSQVQIPIVNGQARMSMAQPDIQLVMQAQRISEQQRQAVQMRQAQQQTHPMQHANAALQNSPPAMRAAVANGVNQKNYMNNTQAMMAAFNAQNGGGMSAPTGAGLSMPNGQSGSPRPNPAMSQPIHQTYLSQLQHIESQIRQAHPNTPQDAVREMAKQVLSNRHNPLTQSAMNAAAGGPGQTAIANGPHQYAQLLRAQQQAAQAAAVQAHQQQQQQHPGVQHQRNSSAGSPTPPVPTVQDRTNRV